MVSIRTEAQCTTWSEPEHYSHCIIELVAENEIVVVEAPMRGGSAPWRYTAVPKASVATETG